MHKSQAFSHQLLSRMEEHKSGSDNIFSRNYFPVVHHKYESDVFKENVILGNDALMKCVVPSFVADLISIDSWVDNSGLEMRSGRNFGKN